MHRTGKVGGGGGRRGGGRKLREEGNSHQPLRELLRRGTRAGCDQAEGRAGRGGPREREQGENHPDHLFLSSKKTFPGTAETFFLRALCLGRRRVAAVLGSARVTHAGDPKGVSGEVPGGPGVIRSATSQSWKGTRLA